MNILIVDDELLELEQLSFLIHQKYPEWKLFEAEDAVQAKKILHEHDVDLALLDIHLPGESGLALCRYIKQHFETECVMVTAHAEFQYAQNAIKMQVFDYLVKPIMTDELYRMLDRFIQQYGYVEGVSDIVKQALEFIRKNYRSKINLTDLAQRIHVSPNYLSRKFSKEIGMSFQEYLVVYRIEMAKKFLKEHSDWSIQKVSEETGFTSINHFSHSFKKHVHLTPRQYKEKKAP